MQPNKRRSTQHPTSTSVPAALLHGFHGTLLQLTLKYSLGQNLPDSTLTLTFQATNTDPRGKHHTNPRTFPDHGRHHAVRSKVGTPHAEQQQHQQQQQQQQHQHQHQHHEIPFENCKGDPNKPLHRGKPRARLDFCPVMSCPCVISQGTSCFRSSLNPSVHLCWCDLVCSCGGSVTDANHGERSQLQTLIQYGGFHSHGSTPSYHQLIHRIFIGFSLVNQPSSDKGVPP